MNVVAELVLVIFLPLAVGAYFVLPPRRATLVVFIGGWLFLPVPGFEFEGLPSYTKITVITLAVMIGTAATEPRRLLGFVPRWFDVPIVVWCVTPLFTSVANGLGVYDGLSSMLTQTLTWGVPWLMGRIWFSDAEGMRELAMGVVVGGLVYVPLCLFEVRMSPQLHNMVYGMAPSSFVHVGRFGGWRPIVFMRSGLEVGLWMSAATVAGVWLWRSGVLRHVFGVPIVPLLGVLALTTLLVKSLGAIMLMVVGLGVLYAANWTRLAVPALIVAAMVPAYMYARTTGAWSGDLMLSAAEVISVERAESLGYRLENEDLLVERALERPLLGWGGWGRSRVIDEVSGQDMTTTDGMWIIAFGQYGLVGLTALTAAMLLPIILLWRRCPAKWWRGPPAVMAVITLMFMADNLLNAMPNPMYVIAAGAICGMPAAVMRAVGAQPAGTTRAARAVGASPPQAPPGGRRREELRTNPAQAGATVARQVAGEGGGAGRRSRGMPIDQRGRRPRPRLEPDPWTVRDR